MRYFQVDWIHEDEDYPISIIAEIDGEGWEVRKIELFRDGHKGFAENIEDVGETMLGEKPWPGIEVIASDSQFNVKELVRSEFESEWLKRFENL
ncbi:DUF6881 domain-containing protein [Undibacterium macrobrachii]|jgi:hypothetical protein|uniref:DUF6881 domain-containing protein n=1 Tax=Undibacterium macrobrachii TaxID=1119058 RepID=A0ABQ2XD88_9BURK|nr:hypothetical protein [Undibacterium macrobrachii]GGX11719.1 hypothetical protein GCM10011282_17730 [Undibacterium macrobrachii]